MGLFDRHMVCLRTGKKLSISWNTAWKPWINGSVTAACP